MRSIKLQHHREGIFIILFGLKWVSQLKLLESVLVVSIVVIM
ncbi:hypothetical protein [Staphylococcus delphini]|nr:hypothetical protein [Staphylococcus delphini]